MIEIGSRVTYQGENWVVMIPMPFLQGKRWLLMRRNGEARSGWTRAIALESDLSGGAAPTFTLGEEVRVGFSPWRNTGEVVEVISSGERVMYRIEVPAEKIRTEEGTRYLNTTTMTVGAEFLNV